jgi:hypothetical protein
MTLVVGAGESYYGGQNSFLNWWGSGNQLTVLTSYSQITAATWSGGFVTFTTTGNHTIPVGGMFTVANMNTAGYNGPFSASSTTANTITAALASNPGTATGALGQIELSGAQAWNAVGVASAGGGTAYFNPATGELNNPCPSDFVSFVRAIFDPPPKYQNLASFAMPGGNPWYSLQSWLIAWLGISTPTAGGYGSGGAFVINGGSITGMSSSGGVTTATVANSFVAGQVVGLYFGVTTTGTFGAVLNNTFVTVISANSTSFTFTNFGWRSGSAAANTTGLTFASGTASANGATLTLGTNPTVTYLTFNVSNFNAPPQNILAYQTQYGANVAAGQTFNPGWINDIKQFGRLRFMNYCNVIGSGATDISQLADANYNSQIKYAGSLANFTGSISGNILTVSSITNDSTVGPGMSLTGASVSLGTQIIGGGGSSPGSGLTGTYLLNNSQTVSSQAMQAVGILGTFNGTYGPKSAIHPSLVCQIANATGCDVIYNVPGTTTDGMMTEIATYFQSYLNYGLRVIFEFNNENWNSGSGTYFFCNAQTYPGTGTTGDGIYWAGYRAAQLWEQVYNVFGSGGRARWRGALGSQMVNTSITLQGLSGALYWLTNGSARTYLTDLFDEVLVAPYFGNGESSVTITGATAVGSTTTLSTSGGNPATIASVLRLFFASTTAGTLGALLNNVDVTVASSTYNSATKLGSITFTNYGGNSGGGTVNTTGLTYSAGSPGNENYAANGLLFDLMDDSLTNFENSPGTYPTQYTYFAQEVSKSIITGVADNGYTTTIGGGFTNAVGDIPNLMQQHALIANSFGAAYGNGSKQIVMRCYEGGNSVGGNLDSNMYNVASALTGYNTQFVDYIFNWMYDGTQTGAYTMQACYAAYGAAVNFDSSGYPAQFIEAGQPSPWCGLPYFPGGESTPTWEGIVALNAKGPYVDPTPPATWSGGFVSDSRNPNYLHGSGSATQTFSINFGTFASLKVAIGIVDSSAATIESVTVGGVSFSPDVSNGNDTVIYGGVISSVGVDQVITIVWSAGFGTRVAFVYAFDNLDSNAPIATAVGTSGTTINATKGAAIVVVGNASSTVGTFSGGTSGLVQPTSQNQQAITGTSALFDLDFSSSIFNVTSSAPASLAMAAYR